MQSSTEQEVKPFRWSFSQWENYDSCPARWRFKSVLRLPGLPPGPAAARGLELHDRVEKAIETGASLAPTAARFGDKGSAAVAPKYLSVIQAFREHSPANRHTEWKMAMDEDWFLCGPNTKFSSCVAILDAVKYTRPNTSSEAVVDIAEWKSGSPKSTHADQRKLYALFGLRGWLADVVNVTTYYLEHEDLAPERLVVKASAQEKLQELWKGRVEGMKSDQFCAPRPGVHCNWCDYAKKKGGPCQFGS